MIKADYRTRRLNYDMHKEICKLALFPMRGAVLCRLIGDTSRLTSRVRGVAVNADLFHQNP